MPDERKPEVISNFTLAAMASLMMVCFRCIFEATRFNKSSKISGVIFRILLYLPISLKRSSSKSDEDAPCLFLLKIHGHVLIRFSGKTSKSSNPILHKFRSNYFSLYIIFSANAVYFHNFLKNVFTSQIRHVYVRLA